MPVNTTPAVVPGQCRKCDQGYTREGFGAYPDHIRLCPLHAATADLLAASKLLVEVRNPFYSGAVSEAEAEKILEAAIAKAEAK